MQLASRLSHVSPSLTLAIDAKAKEMKASGVDVCLFTVGEPDFETPQHIKDAAVKALHDGKTRYGVVAGEIKLRQAISNKLRTDNKLDFGPENIVVSNGGKHALFNTIFATIEPGDEVIIPAPYWLSYPEMVRLAGGTPVILPTTAQNNFKTTAAELEKAITPRTKLFVLNSPSNPTGMIYTKKELEALAHVLVKKNIYVLSDEIYEKLVYDEPHVSIGSLGADIFKQTIVSNGFAKAYAMTGWRIGYVAGPSQIIKAVANVQSHTTSNICTFAQYGAIAALEGPQTALQTMHNTFRGRRELIVGLMQGSQKLTCVQPDGAFYVFPDISKTGLTSLAFCQRLLDECQVAAVPGAVFGDDKYIRLSYATDSETIKKGVQRLKEFVSKL